MSRKIGASSNDGAKGRNVKLPQGNKFPGKALFGDCGIRRMPLSCEVKRNDKKSDNPKKTVDKSKPKQIIIQDESFSRHPKDYCNSDESINSLRDILHFRPISTKSESNSLIKTTSLSESLSSGSILHINNDENQSPSSQNLNEEMHIISPFKGISLKDMNIHKKVLREHNQQKKEQFYHTIRQNPAENIRYRTKKIEEIKSELSNVQIEFLKDIAELRKQIEITSQECIKAK